MPLFMEKCIQFIEEYGLSTEGLYRVSGYKNQVELVITKLTEGRFTRPHKMAAKHDCCIRLDPSYDLRLLQVPATAVATALKDMMRKLDEPLLSLEIFEEYQHLTSMQLTEAFTASNCVFVLVDQLREQEFMPLRKVFSRASELKYRTIKFIFKHLHL